MLGKELVELLLLSLVKVRLVHHHQGIGDVHLGVLEVLAEDHLHVAPGVGLGVGCSGVLVGLVTQVRVVGATEDVCTLDLPLLEHLADELLEGAGLPRLAEGKEDGEADHGVNKGHHDLVGGGGLLRGGHCDVGDMLYYHYAASILSQEAVRGVQ